MDVLRGRSFDRLLLAGPPEAAARCRTLLPALSRRVFEAGDRPEHAAAVKLANSLLLGCAIEAMGEAYALVRKYGVAPSVLYDMMTDGLFSAPAYKGYGKIKGKTFRIAHMGDMQVAMLEEVLAGLDEFMGV